jgi:hypothetical protein
MSDSTEPALSRRAALRTLGLLASVALSPSCQRALESGVDLSAPPIGDSLSEDQLNVIAILAELIIPETDTPGAIEAGVPAFIHQIVIDWYTPAEQQIFLNGLGELDAIAERHWSATFRALDPERQARVLAEMEPPSEGEPPTLASLPPGASGEAPFYVKLKELTVVGYYTSELAARTELDYQPVPGRYDGNARFDEAGRQWVR